jgi:hypothetical protein
MVFNFGFFLCLFLTISSLFTLPRSWEQPLYGQDAIYENFKTDRRQLQGFHVLTTCTTFVALKTGKDDPKREKAGKK